MGLGEGEVYKCIAHYVNIDNSKIHICIHCLTDGATSGLQYTEQRQVSSDTTNQLGHITGSKSSQLQYNQTCVNVVTR